MKLFRIATVGAGSLALATGCALDGRMLTIAGAGGASGHAGAGGSAGVDGASDSAPLPVCQGIPARAAFITDFTDAHTGVNAKGDPDIEFGGADDLGGGSYTFQAPFLLPAVLSLAATADGHALAITANPGVPHDAGDAWLGFGFGTGFTEGSCLDASVYSGVQFTVAGSLGTCQLGFGVGFSEVQDVELNPATGSCPARTACNPPHSGPLVPDAAGIVKVRFVDMKFYGNPTNTVDPKALTGIEWQLTAPLTGDPCVAVFTIDDVAFF